MASNYEKGMYNQLLEVMERLNAVESGLRTEKIAHKDDMDRLNVKLNNLTQENLLVREDNARLKSIINHDSSNTFFSLPPINKGENLPTPIMGVKNTMQVRWTKRV